MAETATQLSPEDLERLIRETVRNTVRETIEDYLEDLAALASPRYLESIREAREEAGAGLVVMLEDLPSG